jgi:misacylated tRNA(Ala) deacylase
MQPNQGRLQTGEHILAKFMESLCPGTKVAIAVFDNPDYARVDFSSPHDLRQIDRTVVETEVNAVIAQDLPIRIETITRQDAASEFDLTRVPDSVAEIRVVDIVGFDRRPCKDPHVTHTAEIGQLSIIDISKVGKDRYRFRISVRNV